MVGSIRGIWPVAGSRLLHGDTTGVDQLRRALTDWLHDMRLVSAAPLAELGRYVGYYEPYATSYDALDRDRAVQEEVRNAARALVRSVRAMRRGAGPSDAGLAEPRPK